MIQLQADERNARLVSPTRQGIAIQVYRRSIVELAGMKVMVQYQPGFIEFPVMADAPFASAHMPLLVRVQTIPCIHESPNLAGEKRKRPVIAITALAALRFDTL